MPINKGKQDFPVLLISIFLLLFLFSFKGPLLGNTILALETDVVTDSLEDYATFLADQGMVDVVNGGIPLEIDAATPSEEISGEEIREEIFEEPYEKGTEETEFLELEEPELEEELEVREDEVKEEPIKEVQKEVLEEEEIKAKDEEELELPEELEEIQEELSETITVAAFMEDTIKSPNSVVVIIGENAPAETLMSALQLASIYGFKIVKDSAIEDISTVRAIALGSSSTNSVSASAFEQGAVASEEGPYYIYEDRETSGIVLVVAGATPRETRKAVKELLRY